jgi:pimeloyl-ACP methyl ester carboxylesterase
MGRITRIVVISLFLLTSCQSTPVEVVGETPIQGKPTPIGRCGDGICDGPENPSNCPQDCPAPEGTSPTEAEVRAAPAERNGKIARVTNPTSGIELSVIALPPEGDQAQGYPTVVLVPGGSGSSQDFTRPGRMIIQQLNEAGYLVVIFDPDGRGRSEGIEDNNGHTHQDGLAAVIRYAADHPRSDGEGIGLISYSFGITMCSGALARHPDLPVSFLIDWEGPADRNDTGSCDEANVGHLGEIASCDDELFWSEREAQSFIGQVSFPYLRLQSEIDHVQPDVSHALRMVNAAVAGAPPWVRLNDLPVNQTYDPSSPPPLFSEDDPRSLDDMVLFYVSEMFELH